MANKTIPELTPGATLDGTELVPMSQGAVTLRTTTQDIANIDRVKGSTLTSGADYVDDLTVTVNPAAATTCQVTGWRATVLYTSDQTISAPGWAEGAFKVINSQGAGTKDKLVGDRVQLNAIGGSVNSAIAYEMGLNTIGAATVLQNVIGFLVPDLAGIANIGNVNNFNSFVSLYQPSRIVNCGRYEKWVDVRTGEPRVVHQEMGPTHAGYVAGRFYLPFGATGTFAGAPVAANTVYTANIKIPARTTVLTLQLPYLVGIAASTARIALYHVNNGIPGARIFESGNQSTAVLGGGTITGTFPADTELEAGIYCAQVICSAGITLPFIGCDNIGLNGTSSLSTLTSNLLAAPGAYGELPSPSLTLTLSALPSQNTSPMFALTS